MKKEIFNCILNVVSDVLEVSKEEILGKVRTNDVLEARCLSMYFSKKYGLSDKYLQSKFNRKSTFAISKLVNCFECYEKHSFAFKQAVFDIKSRLSQEIKLNTYQIPTT